MNTPTIMRLVQAVATDFGLPFAFVSAVATGDVWEIVVNDTLRHRPFRFSMNENRPEAMRGAIKDRLEALLES